jgi:beta-barrel assembly-enhancing protease
MKCYWVWALLIAAPATAAPKADEISAYRALTAQDARVASIGYKLAEANAPFCKAKSRNPGWVLHSYRQYPDREVAQKAFTFPTPLAISALVENGPASRAGLKVGDGLVDMPGGLWIGGELIKHKPSAELVDTVNGRMRELFSANDPVKLRFLRGLVDSENEFVLTLDPPPICASDFWVDTQSKRDAGADGQRVRITSALVEYAQDDAELAAIIAHELAHNILQHPQKLNAPRRKNEKRPSLTDTELEADRLSVWLVTNAGYDPRAAQQFWERCGKKSCLGPFRIISWKKRHATIGAEIALLNASPAKDGLRDPPILQAHRHEQ